MIRLGLDIGYSSIKAVYDDGRFRIPSIVGTYEDWFTVNTTRQVVELDGKKYLVGSDAIDQSQIVERREDRAWIKSDMYSRLLNYSLLNVAFAGGFQTASMHVVSGLPMAYFNKDAEYLKSIIVGVHSGGISGDNITVTVDDARIVPQPFGALLNYALSDIGGIIPENASGRVGVIDIGGKTTNILSVNDLAEQSREATSVGVGGWTVTRKLREILISLYPEIDDRISNMERVLVDKSFIYFGKKIDATEEINSVTESIAGQIKAEISQKWGSASQFEKILISGGGAHLISESLIEMLPQAFMVSEPVFANANGFYKFAKRSS